MPRLATARRKAAPAPKRAARGGKNSKAPAPKRTIGTLAESSLHAALKRAYAGEDGETEVRVDGYWIDARRGDTLIEIQTGSFAGIRAKLNALLERHRVHLVWPVPAELHLLTVDADGVIMSRRKSPKRGRVEMVFKHLVAFPELLAHPNLTLEVVLTREHETRRATSKKRRYDKGWTRVSRELVDIAERCVFGAPADLLTLLPQALPEVFTNADLARHARMPRALAGQMTYCLRRMTLLLVVGASGRALALTVNRGGAVGDAAAAGDHAAG
jgi:hypothetical protein